MPEDLIWHGVCQHTHTARNATRIIRHLLPVSYCLRVSKSKTWASNVRTWGTITLGWRATVNRVTSGEPRRIHSVDKLHHVHTFPTLPNRKHWRCATLAYQWRSKKKNEDVWRESSQASAELWPWQIMGHMNKVQNLRSHHLTNVQIIMFCSWCRSHHLMIELCKRLQKAVFHLDILNVLRTTFPDNSFPVKTVVNHQNDSSENSQKAFSEFILCANPPAQYERDYDLS